MGGRARTAALGLMGIAALMALGAGAAALLSGEPPPTTTKRFALSPQECNTRCQSRQTDCIIACDGAASCEASCVRDAEGCAARCRAMARDAGAKLP